MICFVWLNLVYSSLATASKWPDAKQGLVSSKAERMSQAEGEEQRGVSGKAGRASYRGRVMAPVWPFPPQAGTYPITVWPATDHLGSVKHVTQDGTCVSEGAGTGHRGWTVLSILLAKNHFPDRSGFLAPILCKVRSLATSVDANRNLLTMSFVWKV